MTKTEVFRAEQSGAACLAAFHVYGHIGDYPLTKRTTLGRAGSHGKADIMLPEPCISGLHGEFGCAEGHWFYRDLGSTNGSWINGQILEGVCEMRDGDVLTVVPKDDQNEGPMFAGIFVRLRAGERMVWRRISVGQGMKPLRIGRSESGLTPEDPTISGSHATFRFGADGLSVLDEGSLNGVYVNGERCDARRLKALDVVRIGRSFFLVTDGALWEGERRMQKQAAATGAGANPVPAAKSATGAGAAAVSTAKSATGAGASAAPVTTPVASTAAPTATTPGPGATATASAPAREFPGGNRLVIDIKERSVWKSFKKRVLLSEVHLAVEPGEMVLILGGSGAGKSTFIKSVMGYDRAEGTIRYGDKDVYDDYETMKREIGYVPQQDLVRLSDTVEDTLLAAARLRMPGDSTSEEQKKRVEWLMDILGLTDERANMVGAISGGQKKRVSIGIELAADPALFFLDEPDSGLDGVMARGLMEKLRVIADLGKIVMVITHTPDRAADLFTKVVVLGKTEDGVGHLIYYGRPEEALAFFETDKLEKIVHRINRASEGGEGLADEFYHRFAGS